MITIKSATQLYNTITAFNYDKTDEISEWFVQGCKFSLSHGQLGHNHPTIGWYLAVDFERDAKVDAIASIQWVLDQYGQIFTFKIRDMEAYSYERQYNSLLSAPCEEGNYFIGVCTDREVAYELEHDRVIKIISEVPMK